MDTTKIVRGDDLMLFDSEQKSIAFATSHTLTLTSDVTEISCKDSGIWKEAKVNKLGWEITSENLYSTEEYTKLYAKWTNATPIVAYWGTTYTSAAETGNGVDSPVSYWIPDPAPLSYGYVLITNLSVNAASGDNATFSVTLQGIGKLNTVTA